MKPKILTVDDSKAIRTIIKKMLSGYDCEVIEAANGMEGLDVAKKERPALLLLDIDMPGMNGLELLMNLRNLEQFENTPVFMMSSKSSAKNVRLAMELGVKAFIAKPFKREEVLDRMKKVIELSSI